MKPMLPIHGVIVPMLTPFTEAGDVNPAGIERLVEFLVERGVAGLFPLGTTGEGPLLSTKERFYAAEMTVAQARGRVPVIIHTGAISTQETIALTRHARDIGAQAAAVVPPYFYRLTDDALFDHFAAVARAVPDFPIYLYDNPGVTPNVLTTSLVLRLADACPNILGLKDSSGSLDTLEAVNGLKNGEFNTASGPDALVLAGQAMGLDACVSGNANFMPELVVGIVDAVRQGNLAHARTLQRQLNQVRRILGDGRDLSLFKAVCARRNVPVGTDRSPLKPASESQVEMAWQQLTQLGVFAPSEHPVKGGD
jgi:dihydrodipicolinate synthase/N-acetylneuraminate lyase